MTMPCVKHSKIIKSKSKPGMVTHTFIPALGKQRWADL